MNEHHQKKKQRFQGIEKLNKRKNKEKGQKCI